MLIKNILVVDDHIEELKEDIEESYKNENCELHFCGDKDSAMKILESGIQIDLVILDWYLEPENPLLSILIIQKIRGLIFIPIFIWTQHKINYEESFNNGEVDYPTQLIHSIDKSEVTPDSIRQILTTEISKCPSVQISEIYRAMIKKSLEEIFFDLSSIHDVELSALLKIIMGENDTIDWSSDFILNLLHKKLVREEDFENKLKELLTSLPNETINEYKSKDLMINKILYFTPHSKYPRFGDIIHCKGKDLDSYGLIINPDCDLEQKKTRFIEVIELLKIDDDKLKLKKDHKDKIANNNYPSYYYLPAVKVGEGFVNFVAVFKSKSRLLVNRDLKDVKYPEVAPNKISFEDGFIFDRHEIDIELICGFSDPYKSDFLNKLASHNTRIGIPDIKKFWQK